MVTPTPYVTVTGRLSMSMFLQKNQPKPTCPSLQMTTKSTAEGKKNVGKAIEDPVGTGCSNDELCQCVGIFVNPIQIGIINVD